MQEDSKIIFLYFQLLIMAEGAPQENNSIEMKVPLFEPEFLRGRTIETTPTNLDEKWFEFLRDIRRTTMKLRRRTDIMKIKAKTLQTRIDG